MNERLDELTKLWNKNFDGELTPAENARLAELMNDAPLMEAFAEAQAARSEAEGPLFSDEQWKSVDSKVMNAFRRHQSRFGIRALAIFLGAAAAFAAGALIFSGGGDAERPVLALGGEEFTPQPKAPQPRQEDLDLSGSHEVRSAKISVVVEQASLSPASVRILSASGAEVRRVFSGELKPGKFRFEWNGLDQVGRKAAPGSYTIEIKSSKGIERRELEIRSRKP